MWYTCIYFYVPTCTDAYKVYYISRYTCNTLRCISGCALKLVCCQHKHRFLKRQSAKNILEKNNIPTWYETYPNTCIGHTQVHQTHLSKLHPNPGVNLDVYLSSKWPWQFSGCAWYTSYELALTFFYFFFAIRHKRAGSQIIKSMLKMTCHSRLHKENKSQIWDLTCESTGS